MGMGNGETTTKTCLSVSDKALPDMEESLKLLHPTESFPSKNVMGHLHRPLVPSPNGIDDGGAGPPQNDSGANQVERSTTTATAPRTSSSIFFRGCSAATTAAAAAAALRTLQPFDISLTNTAFKSPGGGMAAALSFPFTAAQWKELERQAMIYKYMIASVPVPPDLLLPITTRNLSADPTAPFGSTNSSLHNLRYGNKDPEPGRCKRTDGKKWRCSRDVAPHQKYCERHMHRGRPRSRKPVELNSSVDNTTNNKKSRLNSTPTALPNATAQANHSSSPQYFDNSIQLKDTLLLDASSGQNAFTSSYKEPKRVFGWEMEGEVVAANGAEQRLLHLMDTKRGLAAEDSIYHTNASILQHGYGEEPLNLFSYTTDFGPAKINNRNDQCHLFLNSDLISQKQPQTDPHRGYIDAWSNGDLKTIQESSVTSAKGNLARSSLTLSMAMDAGIALDESRGLAADTDHYKPKDCPVSWLHFPLGGPLAEVLQPSSIASGSNPASPYASNGDPISSPATTVSSPTGILHKALLFSHSDGSVYNTPTLAASAAPPEMVAFQWLS